MVAASSLALFGLSVGQTIGGPARSTALLAPRGQDPGGQDLGGPDSGEGPADFQINKTAAVAGIGPVDESWRLELTGPATTAVTSAMSLSRAQLLALPQHTARLSIACVEGWSTGVQTWTGVRLADLAGLVGAPSDSRLFVESLQRGGGFGSAILSAGQVGARDAVLALRVNGVDLTPDHGFPARVVVPALPGVHNTKWVTRMTFLPASAAPP
jgi:DMSO/TMAO reductase YedYZ molybdopterin-dependent catalytic subunit